MVKLTKYVKDPYIVNFINIRLEEYQSHIVLGDFPYAAWNNTETYESGKWSGRFFSHPVKEGCISTMYIPHYCNLFCLLHELGHVKDYKEGKVFESVWEDEVSAWVNAVHFINMMDIVIDPNDLIFELENTLATYVKSCDNTDWINAVDLIISKIKNK